MRAIDPEVETNLDFLLEVTLETRPDYLALTRLQSIRHRRDGSNVVRHGEENQLPVDEVREGNLSLRVVEIGPRLHRNP